MAITFVTGASPRSLAMAVSETARRDIVDVSCSRGAGPDAEVDPSALSLFQRSRLIHRIVELCTEVWIAQPLPRPVSIVGTGDIPQPFTASDADYDGPSRSEERRVGEGGR